MSPGALKAGADFSLSYHTAQLEAILGVNCDVVWPRNTSVLAIVWLDIYVP